MGGFLTDGGGTDSLLELAVNTHLNPDPDPDPNPKQELPLRALLTTMRRASLVVTIHGAGMINQVFMPVVRA